MSKGDYFVITTITGDNDFGRSTALRQITADFQAAHGDSSVTSIDCDNTSLSDIRQHLEALSLFDPHKLIVLYQPSSHKEFCENFEAICERIPETTDVILLEPKLDKRTSYYKTLQKQTNFMVCSQLSDGELVHWLTKRATELGATITTPNARFLIERVGHNQHILNHELEKLALYSPDITENSITTLTEKSPQSTIFDLLDAAFSGNQNRAVALYKEQRQIGMEPHALIGMLAWQLHIVALVVFAGSQTNDQIARAASVSPYVVNKSRAIAKKISKQKLDVLIQNLRKLDVELKTTKLDADEALLQYILAINTSE